MKMTNLYYPNLLRQEISVYYKSEGVFYSTYNCKSNYDNVARDCQYRCVYCDAKIDECGGEPFSLDHFRPMNVFLSKFDGVLKTHPFNLYLSCQKCNVLKTDDWKGCKDTIDGVTYIANKGYIDRFGVDIKKHLQVDSNGAILCINEDGPGEYMIRKMLLNRTNRIYIRKRRAVKAKASRVLELLAKKQSELISEAMPENFEEKMNDIQNTLSLLERFNKLNLMLV